MKLGYFTMPLHPPSRNYADTLAEDREAIILADKLGFTEAYVGEHVTDTAETVTDCVVFLASLAHDTKNIMLCTGTVNLANTHPAAIATKVAMLDNITRGRVIMGISPGGLPSDWEVFGNLDINRNEKFVECIDAILAIWNGTAPYNIEGKHWKVSTERTMIPDIGQGIMVKPFQKPGPHIVVTVVEPFSRGCSEAAKRGWSPISANFLLPQWVKSHWGKYVEGCEAGNLKPDAKHWRVAKTIFVAEDEKVAKEYAFGANSPYRFYYKQISTKLIRAGRANLFKENKDQPDSDITVDYILDRLVIAGTPDQVARQIVELRGTVGDFGTLLYCGMDWVDPKLARRSMELMAEKVMPQVNQAIGQ
ncbi:MAG TPA: LLM class flavin-dependent oxidoreductase [Burkholderiales bacterium]|jgi:alkanesulfonate monooxygenase SsuD/methylene tetrahydromethanopterin reductase-like flavin-dependent oxidoreductase (luciferase family)